MFLGILAVVASIFISTTYGQEINLGTASLYAVIGATTITNTGLTLVDGSLAVFPGTSITGFPPGIFTGIESDGDAVASTVHNDAMTAFNAVASLTCGKQLAGQDLGGMTLTPGVYCFSSSAFITGTLTLDGQGNQNAVFIFQIGSTLITATAAKVILANGAQPCGVFWAVGSSATLGSATIFVGNILALTSITLDGAVSVSGGLYALSGAVTLIDDQIAAVGSCGSLSPSPSGTTTIALATTLSRSTTPAAKTSLCTLTTVTTTITKPTTVTATKTTTSTITKPTTVTATKTTTSTITKPTTVTATKTVTK
jgi:hypothetical protein